MRAPREPGCVSGRRGGRAPRSLLSPASGVGAPDALERPSAAPLAAGSELHRHLGPPAAVSAPPGLPPCLPLPRRLGPCSAAAGDRPSASALRRGAYALPPTSCLPPSHRARAHLGLRAPAAYHAPPYLPAQRSRSRGHRRTCPPCLPHRPSCLPCRPTCLRCRHAPARLSPGRSRRRAPAASHAPTHLPEKRSRCRSRGLRRTCPPCLPFRPSCLPHRPSCLPHRPSCQPCRHAPGRRSPGLRRLRAPAAAHALPYLPEYRSRYRGRRGHRRHRRHRSTCPPCRHASGRRSPGLRRLRAQAVCHALPYLPELRSRCRSRPPCRQTCPPCRRTYPPCRRTYPPCRPSARHRRHAPPHRLGTARLARRARSRRRAPAFPRVLTRIGAHPPLRSGHRLVPRPQRLAPPTLLGARAGPLFFPLGPLPRRLQHLSRAPSRSSALPARPDTNPVHPPAQATGGPASPPRRRDDARRRCRRASSSKYSGGDLLSQGEAPKYHRRGRA